MRNINIIGLEKEAEILNELIDKIQEAKPGSYLLKNEYINQAIILSNFDYIETITNKVISIDVIDNQYIIIIDEAKENGLSFL